MKNAIWTITRTDTGVEVSEFKSLAAAEIELARLAKSMPTRNHVIVAPLA